MYAISDVICCVYVCVKCWVVLRAWYSNATPRNITPQLPYSPPITKENNQKKIINIKRNVCDK